MNKDINENARLKADNDNLRKALEVVEEDRIRLKAEVERLKEGNECLDQMHEKEMARSDFLCEQVERLTKAGDAMAIHYFDLYWSINAQSTSRYEPSSITNWKKQKNSNH
jgi:regulator of replication initiation timing